MYCQNCGFQISIDSNFCSNCGVAVKDISKVAEVSSQPVYEICKVNAIVVEGRGFFNRFSTYCWFAEVVSAKGNYIAAKSNEFKAFNSGFPDGTGKMRDEIKGERDNVISQLLKSGWEPIDTEFYPSFRRRVK